MALKHSRRRRWLAVAAAVLLLLAGMTVWVDGRVRGMMGEYGVNQAKTICTRAINETVGTLLRDEAVSYADLVRLTVDDNGTVRSLEADTAGVNRLKAEITGAVLNRLEAADVQTVRIPLGTLTGSGLLSGRGPSLPVKTGITATVLSDIRSEFSEAGINQTCHQLYLCLRAELFTALPGAPQTVIVTTDYLLAETVLAGDVPQMYGFWNRYGATE